jgi:hypothetical protein
LAMVNFTPSCSYSFHLKYKKRLHSGQIGGIDEVTYFLGPKR